MSFTEFLKKLLINYFIIVTGITVAIAIIGLSFYPKERLPYNAFFSPLIFGAVATLPAVVMYSKKELTFKQMLIRRILHFIILEISQLGIGYITGLIKSFDMVLMLSSSVLAVYLFRIIIGLIIDSRTAIDINNGLKRIQE